MAMRENGTVVAVFTDSESAQSAVRALKDAGFVDSQIGVAGAKPRDPDLEATDEEDDFTMEGAVAGAATGAGVGALWGLAILAGVLPGIGPAIAGGTLAVLLSSAAAGAAAAGLAGALIGMGIPKEEAEFYEAELKSGRTIITVDAQNRRTEATRILHAFGAYDMSTRGDLSTTEGELAATPEETAAATRRPTHTTVDVPVAHEEIAGERPPVETVPGVGPGPAPGVSIPEDQILPERRQGPQM